MSDTISLKTGTAYIPVIPLEDPNPQVTTQVKKGRTLEEINNQNKIHGTSEELLENANQSTSFISRIINWWQAKGEGESETNVQKTFHPQELPVNFVPQISPPEGMPTELQKVKLPRTLKQEQKLSDKEIFEGLDRMSENTMHLILMIVLKNQTMIEHEAALTSFDMLLNFQKQKTYEQKVLKEVKQALERDNRVAEYFKTTQNVAIAAAALTGIVTTIGTAGIAAPIAALLGATAGSIVMAGLTILPYAAGALGAVSAGTKSYYQVRASEDAKKFKEHHHTNQVLDRIISDWQEYVDRWSKSKTNSEKNTTKIVEDLMELSKMLSKRK